MNESEHTATLTVSYLHDPELEIIQHIRSSS